MLFSPNHTYYSGRDPFVADWLEKFYQRHLKRKKKIAVIGMKGAGKTTFWSFLQGKPYVRNQQKEAYQTVKPEPIPKFRYTKGNGDLVRVHKGVDIPGGHGMAIDEMKQLIMSNNIIVFLFDINEYFTNTESKNSTNGRLEGAIKAYKKKTGKKQFYIWATHIDELHARNSIDVESAISKFKEYLRSRKYPQEIRENFHTVQLVGENGYTEQLKRMMDRLI